MLLDEVTAGLPTWATQSAGVAAARVAPVAGYIQIQDLAHPWVVIEWPADEPLPFGWIALSQVRQDYAPGVQFPPGAPRVDVAPLSGYADTLARLSAERAVFGADARRASLPRRPGMLKNDWQVPHPVSHDKSQHETCGGGRRGNAHAIG